MIISISGLATAGKNSLAKVIIDNYFGQEDTKELSFAEPLRNELFGIIKQNFGIDVFTAIGQNKEIVRPLMVAWANARRTQSEGLYFVEKMRKKLEFLNSSYKHYIITDLRFAHYQYDEINFCKEIGKVIHIKKYNIINKGHGEFDKVFVSPPNETEAENDPKIQKMADLCIEWQQWDGSGIIYDRLYSQIKTQLDSFLGNII